MTELPLFPLNMVLFPGMPVALHIFEKRYRQMVEWCLATSKPFGVVLIKQGQEAWGPLALPYEIGCTAKIVQVHHLDQERMNIVAVGRERFRSVHYHHLRPYLMSEIELFPFDTRDPQALHQAGERLRPWVEWYLTRLSDIEELEFEPDFLPDTALALAFTAVHLLQIQPLEKQALLVEPEAVTMVYALQSLYRREVALTNAMLTRNAPTDIGMFSIN